MSKKDELKRRNNLIAVAQKLFLINGYENTTINDMVDRLKLAKGTFYYHFRSKEEILTAVSEKLLSETQRELKKAHELQNEDVYQRLKMIIEAIKKDVHQNERIWGFVYQEKNTTLYGQLIKICMEKFTPLIAEVLTEGGEAGLLDVPHPMEMAEALVTLLDLYARKICGEEDERRRVRIQASFKHILERMLNEKCVPEFELAG